MQKAHCTRQRASSYAEHVILDCPSQNLIKLRTQFQHLSSSATSSSASRLTDFTNQAGILGLATLRVLLQLSCPRRHVQLCNPPLSFP
eukprot:1139174-Pelagomonas_calceolata.AAC.3